MLEILLDKKAIKYVGELNNILGKAVKSLNDPVLLAEYLKKADRIIDKIHDEYCMDSECDSLVLVIDHVYYSILRILNEVINNNTSLDMVADAIENYLLKLERLLPKEYRERGSLVRRLLGLF